MRIRFWGTRGSFVSPGGAFQRFGGNTICAEVTAESGTRIVLDLGTGCIALGQRLAGDAAKGASKRLLVLLGNTQIDHIQGLPFFVPALAPGWDVTIMGPTDAGRDISGVLDNALNPNYSPLYGLENLAAKIALQTISEGEIAWDGFRILTRELPHGAGKALGYRIEADGKALAYLADVEYGGDPTPRALDLASDADLLVHDAMATQVGVVKRREFDHAPVDDAVFVARNAHAKRLLLYHHDPDRTDGHMDALVEKIRGAAGGIRVEAAHEGDVIEL